MRIALPAQSEGKVSLLYSDESRTIIHIDYWLLRLASVWELDHSTDELHELVTARTDKLWFSHNFIALVCPEDLKTESSGVRVIYYETGKSRWYDMPAEYKGALSARSRVLSNASSSWVVMITDRKETMIGLNIRTGEMTEILLPYHASSSALCLTDDLVVCAEVKGGIGVCNDVSEASLSGEAMVKVWGDMDRPWVTLPSDTCVWEGDDSEDETVVIKIYASSCDVVREYLGVTILEGQMSDRRTSVSVYRYQEQTGFIRYRRVTGAWLSPLCYGGRWMWCELSTLETTSVQITNIALQSDGLSAKHGRLETRERDGHLIVSRAIGIGVESRITIQRSGQSWLVMVLSGRVLSKEKLNLTSGFAVSIDTFPSALVLTEWAVVAGEFQIQLRWVTRRDDWIPSYFMF